MKDKSNMKAFLIVIFISVSVGANIATANLGLVPIGFGLAVTAGTFLAGAALVLRDGLHEAIGGRQTYEVIVVAALASALTAGPTLAIASGVAFAASEMVDALVYSRIRDRSRALAILASGAVGLTVDTLLFLQIAGFPITTGVFLGQALVKGTLTVVASAYVGAKR